jgi:hypothetical protein
MGVSLSKLSTERCRTIAQWAKREADAVGGQNLASFVRFRRWKQQLGTPIEMTPDELALCVRAGLVHHDGTLTHAGIVFLTYRSEE